MIVEGKSTGRLWIDKIFDLRVDDGPEPLAEIRRLVSIRRAYIHRYRAGAAVERGDLETMEREYAAAERLIGEKPEMRYWHAIALLTLGKSDDGIAMLSEIATRDRNWVELTLRLPSMKWLPDPSVTERVRKLLK